MSIAGALLALLVGTRSNALLGVAGPVDLLQAQHLDSISAANPLLCKGGWPSSVLQQLFYLYIQVHTDMQTSFIAWKSQFGTDQSRGPLASEF